MVAGGHVGVLLHLLHVFGLAAAIRPPLITWSAGAMALSERVVLYHDHGPPGRQHPEVYAEGLGAYSGRAAVPAPEAPAARRATRTRSRLLARRFAPLDLPAASRRRPGRPAPTGDAAAAVDPAAVWTRTGT